MRYLEEAQQHDANGGELVMFSISGGLGVIDIPRFHHVVGLLHKEYAAPYVIGWSYGRLKANLCFVWRLRLWRCQKQGRV